VRRPGCTSARCLSTVSSLTIARLVRLGHMRCRRAHPRGTCSLHARNGRGCVGGSRRAESARHAARFLGAASRVNAPRHRGRGHAHDSPDGRVRTCVSAASSARPAMVKGGGGHGRGPALPALPTQYGGFDHRRADRCFTWNPPPTCASSSMGRTLSYIHVAAWGGTARRPLCSRRVEGGRRVPVRTRTDPRECERAHARARTRALLVVGRWRAAIVAGRGATVGQDLAHGVAASRALPLRSSLTIAVFSRSDNAGHRGTKAGERVRTAAESVPAGEKGTAQRFTWNQPTESAAIPREVGHHAGRGSNPTDRSQRQPGAASCQRCAEATTCRPAPGCPDTVLVDARVPFHVKHRAPDRRIRGALAVETSLVGARQEDAGHARRPPRFGPSLATLWCATWLRAGWTLCQAAVR
jgi:hypothetical protein